MKNNSNGKLYDSNEKRLRFLQRRGNIITFKEPFFPWGTANESRRQIIVYRLEKSKSAIKIIGGSFDSDWFRNLNELMEAVDWDWMEHAHNF